MSGTQDESYLPFQANIRSTFGIDTATVQQRRNQVSGSLFGGDVNGKHIFDAGFGEVVYRKRRRGAVSSRFHGGASPINYIPALTALNGAGDETQGRAAFLAQHQYVGLVATQVKLNRDGGFAPDVFPADQHGTTTTVNNGKATINAGSYVMWDVWENADDARAHMSKVNGMPDGRILPYLREYDPIRDCFSPERMEMLREAYNNPRRSGMPVDGLQHYGGLMSSVREMMAIGALAYTYMTNNQGNLNLKDALRSDSGAVENIFRSFGAFSRGVNPQTIGFVDQLTHSILAFDPANDPIATTNGEGYRKINDIMKNWTVRTAQHFKRLDYEIKARVIGQALTTANRGQRFDIFLNQPPV